MEGVRVYTGSRIVYSGEDAIDVTPACSDPIGRALGLNPTSDLQAGLLLRYLHGTATDLQVAALELFAVTRLRADMRDYPLEQAPGRAIVETIARFAARVTIVCDCARHQYSHCLRYAMGREVARGVRGRYVGDLHAQPSGRLVPRPTEMILQQLSAARWQELLRLVSTDVPLGVLADFAPPSVLRRPSASVPSSSARSIPDFARELGLETWPVTEEALTLAWRTVALATHPDRPGGSVARFRRAREAYETARSSLGR